MATFEFEILSTFSDVVTVDADTFEEAQDEAYQQADDYTVLLPGGYSSPFDDTQVSLLSGSEDED